MIHLWELRRTPAQAGRGGGRRQRDGSNLEGDGGAISSGMSLQET